MPDDPRDRSERKETDQSLRTERDRTDHALAENRRVEEEGADAIVRAAREKADRVLVVARDKADERIAGGGTSQVEAQVTIGRERAVADDLLQHERALADESLRLQRAEQARILARLLPMERDKTDRHLWTERVRSDDAVAHRDDFLSIVSHDLRNLLSGIVMSASMLEAGGEDAPSATTTATRIARYAARMNRLIGDLVDIGSIDAGRLAMEPAPGDLATTISEAVETFAPAAAAKNLTLEVEHLERPLPADFDPDRMLQVLANVITNAIKFTNKGGWVRIRCERVGDAIQFAIRDSGPGIPEDMLESVFERFWQVGKNDRRGLGLGLYISRCIVAAHGGTIWVESKLGEGSRFLFRLPAR